MPNLTTRIQSKHDVESNWSQATNFIPLAGELVVYDPDENYDYPRIKVGDGVTAVTLLPFSTVDINSTDIATEELTNVKVGKTVYSVPTLEMAVSDIASDTATTIKTLTIDGDVYSFYASDADTAVNFISNGEKTPILTKFTEIDNNISSIEQNVAENSQDISTNSQNIDNIISGVTPVGLAEVANEANKIKNPLLISINDSDKEYRGDVQTDWGSIYAPTTAGTAGYYLKSNGSGAPTWATIPTASPFFGTCDTSASTSAKTVTITDFTSDNLVNGTKITIYFTYNNTSSSPTLNVSGTGAKNMVTQTGTELTGTVGDWAAGSVVSFVYYNNEWVLQSPTLMATLNGTEYFAGNTEPTWYAPTSAGTKGYILTSNGSGAPTWIQTGTVFYATCSSSSATATKVISTTILTSSFALRTGLTLLIKFTHSTSYTSSTSSIKFNVNSSGSYPVYDRYGNAMTLDGWLYVPAGGYVLATFNGSAWVILSGVSGRVTDAITVTSNSYLISEASEYDRIITFWGDEATTTQRGELALRMTSGSDSTDLASSKGSDGIYSGALRLCVTAYANSNQNVYVDKVNITTTWGRVSILGY